MNKYEEKAYTISEALPYIQRFSGKTIVVKYGGNAMVNDIMKNAVVSDCILLSLVGINTVLVHGGGPEITACSASSERIEVYQRSSLYR